MSCIFCEVDRPIITKNSRAFAIEDAYPVSPGHTLVIPNMHIPNLLDLDRTSYTACWNLVFQVTAELETLYNTRDFNIGVNVGVDAGQTVMHAHIHIIPRFPNDVPDPRGGIRHVIPGKGYYTS